MPGVCRVWLVGSVAEPERRGREGREVYGTLQARSHEPDGMLLGL